MEDFEKQIKDLLQLDDRATRKMDRLLEDIAQIVGWKKQEILEFISFIAVQEVKELELDYDWKRFEKKLLKKLRGV